MELSGAALVSSSSSLKVLRFLLVLVAVAAALSTQLLPSLVAVVPSWPLFSAPRINKQQPGPPRCIVFNFGDSNTDTGNLVAGAGVRLHRPVGRRFFGKPSGRYSDGRLYIDFICERLGLDHLSPYLESSGVSFRQGANFAVAGATTGGAADAASTSFNLGTQVRQFRHFKARTADLQPRGLGSGLTSQEFQNAVYTFDIGQNDLQAAFSAGISYERILETIIPAIVARIKNAITMLHEAGGRKFVLHNTGPLGCLPSMLARRGGELDHAGCLVDPNGVARAFNAQLGRLCRELHAKFANATVVCVDMYAIKYGLFANHTAHGFSEPLMACCGSGGPPYNYRAGKACGSPKVKACQDGDRRISWDGVHYTEAANRVVADEILSAEYSDPPLRLQTLCSSRS
ncbi:GDSL esterase/lipase LIP-4 [Dichanthelium oligosanthes]|uniref:GDSL esterase/lipase LIP-4 n=1 Tax=Dichanthelium oligosanthes TaxID=888268 RepID=A0A1E5VNH0_9POAL|nr:GDSL esterase/lipase LIP-4 [Dichanthelium oligosanthes]